MTIQLTYFNARGRAEMSRMIAAYGKLDYKDVRVEGQDWPALKESKNVFMVLFVVVVIFVVVIIVVVEIAVVVVVNVVVMVVILVVVVIIFVVLAIVVVVVALLSLSLNFFLRNYLFLR